MNIMGRRKVDWNNKDSVIAYAKALARRYADNIKGSPIAVIKHPDRDNYNITHKVNLKQPKYADCVIIYASES